MPQGASLSAVTGEFRFKPQAPGKHSIEFSASDGRFSASSTGTFTVPEPAEGAQSRFSGRVLDAQSLFAGEEVALVGVKVSLHGTSFTATTDSEGRFMLSGYTGGSHVLDLNSSSATSSLTGVGYAGFREKITLRHGVHERESAAFTLPRLAASGATGRVTINPNGETVLREENMGIELRIPRGVARNEDGTPYTGDLYMSEVPRDLAPAALPEFMDPSLLITIQPVGVVFSQPVPITFPNTDDLPPGYEADIWSLDPTTGAFAIVGKVRVTANGESMETVEGGIRRADWHLAAPIPPEEPPEDPPPPDPCECEDREGGSTVNLDTGTMGTVVFPCQHVPLPGPVQGGVPELPQQQGQPCQGHRDERQGGQPACQRQGWRGPPRPLLLQAGACRGAALQGPEGDVHKHRQLHGQWLNGLQAGAAL